MDVLLTFAVHREYESELKSIIGHIKKISIVTSFNCVVTNHVNKSREDILTKTQNNKPKNNENNKESESQEITVKVEPNDVCENKDVVHGDIDKSEIDKTLTEKKDNENGTDDTKYKYEEFDLISDLKNEDDVFLDDDDDDDYIDGDDYEDEEEEGNGDEGENISCDFCKKTFKTDKGLLNHTCVDDENVKNRFCEVCKKLFRNPIKLSKHKCGVIENKCDLCGEDLKYKYKLKEHLKEVHNIERNEKRVYKKRKCNQCGKMTVRMRQHIRVVHEGIKEPLVVCDVCGANFTCKSTLRLHQRRVHENVEKTLACEVCTKMFRFNCELRQHMRIVHDNVKFPCHVCGKMLCTKQALQDHVATVHENIRNFKCDMCDEAFYRQKSLVDHKKIVHIKALDFPCDICGRKYSCQRALTKHKRESHADKYECDICGQNFTNASSLRDHKNRHLRKYACDICSAVFGNITKLKKHLTNVHKIDQQHEAWKKSINE